MGGGRGGATRWEGAQAGKGLLVGRGRGGKGEALGDHRGPRQGPLPSITTCCSQPPRPTMITRHSPAPPPPPHTITTTTHHHHLPLLITTTTTTNHHCLPLPTITPLSPPTPGVPQGQEPVCIQGAGRALRPYRGARRAAADPRGHVLQRAGGLQRDSHVPRGEQLEACCCRKLGGNCVA